ncbi:hypothetical protein XaC1_25 [Xanthomonas phage XaC1]|nr:hypothetical protein XaC1_25 [Xanthomonas phage XaC1]
MKLSKLKEIVRQLEEESKGTDVDIVLYDIGIPGRAPNYELAFQNNEYPLSVMRVENTFALPLVLVK